MNEVRLKGERPRVVEPCHAGWVSGTLASSETSHAHRLAIAAAFAIPSTQSSW